jgi:hypothetical protein
MSKERGFYLSFIRWVIEELTQQSKQENLMARCRVLPRTRFTQMMYSMPRSLPHRGQYMNEQARGLLLVFYSLGLYRSRFTLTTNASHKCSTKSAGKLKIIHMHNERKMNLLAAAVAIHGE